MLGTGEGEDIIEHMKGIEDQRDVQNTSYLTCMNIVDWWKNLLI